MNDNEKLDKLLKLVEENNKILKELISLVRSDTPGREFLLNLGADILGDFLISSRRRK